MSITQYYGGQRGVIEAALALYGQGCAFALAMVVETEGSTYRKPGALALVAEDGRRVGVLSGGCLEPEVEMLGREALAAAAPRLKVFDTRSDDDLLFGSGSGCRRRKRGCGSHRTRRGRSARRRRSRIR